MVLAQIPPFSGTRPDFHLSGTRPDPTFSSTCLDFYFSGTRPDSTLSRYSLGSFFGTRPDQSLMFRILRFFFGFDPFCIKFSNTRSNRFPFCFDDSPSSHSNPLVLMFKIFGIVSRFSYTTSSIVTGFFFSFGIVSESSYLLEYRVQILLSPLASHPDPISSLRHNVRILRHRV